MCIYVYVERNNMSLEIYYMNSYHEIKGPWDNDASLYIDIHILIYINIYIYTHVFTNLSKNINTYREISLSLS